MDKTPVIKISGTRYKAARLTYGAYRQIALLMDVIGQLPDAELKEDMVEVLRLSFGLSRELSDQIDASEIIPKFREVSAWAGRVFTENVAILPNADGPDLPGQS